MFINHCHVSPVSFGDEPEVGTFPHLERILENTGVEGAVVFAPLPFAKLGWIKEAADEFGTPNEWLATELRKRSRFCGYASINPKDNDSSEQLRAAVRMGLVGAKIHPPVMKFTINDPDIDGFFQTAEELDVPIHIHTGVHAAPYDAPLQTYMPILIDDVAQKHPNLRLVIEHLGGYAFFNQALAVIQNNENCYAGLTACSGRVPKYCLPPRRIRILVKTLLKRPSDELLAEKIIYGLDYPWNPSNLAALRYDIEWIRSWDIPEEGKNNILGSNLDRLIGRHGIKGD